MACRLNMDIDQILKDKLKIHAIHDGINLTVFVTRLLKEEIIKREKDIFSKGKK